MESDSNGALLRIIVSKIIETLEGYEIEKSATVDEYNKRVMYINGHIDAYKNMMTMIEDSSNETEIIDADEGRIRDRIGSDNSDGEQ